MRVAVLGSGPAGLVAAEAACQANHNVMIFSATNDPSPIMGAQYLHKPIPGFNSQDPDYIVNMYFLGTAEGYATKVYGDPERATSWLRYEERGYPAWDMRATYSRLYRKWRPYVVAGTVRVETLPGLLSEYDMVISSIPKMHLCHRHHGFDVETTYVETMHNRLADEMFYITYNGLPFVDWSRCSCFKGMLHFEHPQKPSLKETVAVKKAVDTNCDCPEDMGVLTVGRYGRWKAGLLVADVFGEVQSALQLVS